MGACPFAARPITHAIEFRLRYDGGDAVAHQVEMRALGRSLIGAERIISDTIIVAFEQRLPRHGERPPVSIQASAPEANCYDLVGAVVPVAGVLPFVYDVLVNYGTDFIGQAIAYVLTKLGGRPKEADEHFELLMTLVTQMQSDHVHQQDAERAHSLAHSEQMLRLVDKLHAPARQLVAPIGPSCNELRISDGRGRPTTIIDVAMADAIRAKEPVEVGDMAKMIVQVDTVSLSRRSMKVFMPDNPGVLVDVSVRDPVFDETPNIYTEGALGRFLAVDAKPTYKRETGELVRLHVMNAEPAD